MPAAAVLAAALLCASPAAAIELFDGRVQIHGFYEMQTRVLAQNYDTVDGYNLAQWWHIANVEVEWDAVTGAPALIGGEALAEVTRRCADELSEDATPREVAEVLSNLAEIKRVVDRTRTLDPQLRDDARAIELQLLDLQERLSGDRTRARRDQMAPLL